MALSIARSMHYINMINFMNNRIVYKTNGVFNICELRKYCCYPFCNFRGKDDYPDMQI